MRRRRFLAIAAAVLASGVITPIKKGPSANSSVIPRLNDHSCTKTNLALLIYEARARHRSRHLRGLPRLRHRVQGVERIIQGERIALRLRAVRRQALRRLVQPSSSLRGGRVSGDEDDQLSDVLPALRGRRLCK